MRDSVPSLQGEKASRAQILKKAAEYIQFMRRKNNSHQQDIEDLKRHNSMLEQQSNDYFLLKLKSKSYHYFFTVRSLERARTSGNFDGDGTNELPLDNVKSDVSSHESSDENENDNNERRNKRVKTNSSAY